MYTQALLAVALHRASIHRLVSGTCAIGLVVVVGLISVSGLAGCTGAPREQEFLTGFEVLQRDNFSALAGKSVALVTNPTGVDAELNSIIDILAAHEDVALRAVFGPEHGARGAAQAGEHVADSVDSRTGIRFYSLYGTTRRPRPETLEGIDIVLFDVQDIGVRTYTYLSTLLEILEVAAEVGVEVWVLDRPVPIGGDRIGGPVLETAYRSFVGAHELPLRHGLTAGEFAKMVVAERAIDVRLRVVEMQGYAREAAFDESRRPWVAPSPNIPTAMTALIYSGLVLIEGTNLSEGRGTTRPFQIVGAPWLDARALRGELRELDLPGVLFREIYFTPTFSKYAGKPCSGIEMHVIDTALCDPILIALNLIAAVQRLHPEEFQFLGSFERLAGTARLRQALESGKTVRDISESWTEALAEYSARRAKYLLYASSKKGLARRH